MSVNVTTVSRLASVGLATVSATFYTSTLYAYCDAKKEGRYSQLSMVNLIIGATLNKTYENNTKLQSWSFWKDNNYGKT